MVFRKTTASVASAMNKQEQRVFIILVASIWAYLALRSALVPVTHDEAATFLHYLQLDAFIPYFSMWDANNHLLNSALAYLSINLFGNHVFWLRLPNLLAFGLFAYYLYLISGHIKHAVVRWLTVVAMLTASFQIEFFGMARGYGLSLAFLLGAIHYGSAYLKEGKVKDQWKLWGMMLLALLANMSLMNTLIVFGGMVVLHVFRMKRTEIWRHALPLCVAGGGLLALGGFYAMKLKVLGLLYTGDQDGFVTNTVYSFTRFQFEYPSVVLAWVLAIAGLVCCAYLAWKWVRDGFAWNTGTVVGGLLLLNAIGSILLEVLMGVNYPEERTGVYFLTQFILVLGFTADELATSRPVLKWAALPLVFFPIQLLATANMYTSQLWAYIHVDRDVYQHAARLQQSSEIPLRISGARMYELSWAHDNIVYGGGLQLMETTQYPDTTADLIVARSQDVAFGSLNADTVYYNAQSGFALLQPDSRLEFMPADTLSKEMEFVGSEPFFNIAEWEVREANGEHGIIEFSLSGQTTERPMEAHVVITSQNDAGETVSYERIPLYWIRKCWRGEKYSVRRFYRFPPGASRAVVYLWNSGQKPIAVQFSEVIVSRQLKD